MKPYYQDQSVTIYHGDCRQLVPQLGNFDLLLTDPPYGLGKHLAPSLKGEWAKGFSKELVWDKTIVPNWLIHQAIDSSLKSIIWGGNYYKLPIARGWFGWDKIQEHSSGHYELAWTNIDSPTRMFRQSRVQAYGSMSKQHPTQKPVELMQWCINLAGDVQTILDPFAGSGTTGRAAKDLGKQAVLIEMDEQYCEVAAQRMAQEVLL